MAAQSITNMEYRKLLNKISKDLGENELHKLKYLCKDESIGLRSVSDCVSGHDIFDELERKSLISKTDLELLKELLILLEKIALINEVEEKVGEIQVTKRISSYRRMVLECSDLIGNTSEFQKLKSVIGNALTNAEKEKMHCPIHIMFELEKQGKMGPEKLEILIAIGVMLQIKDIELIVQEHMKEVERYTMENIPRGKFLIINNIHFRKPEGVLEDREGSVEDQKNLKALFKQKLKFDVEEKNDLTSEEIKTAVKKASEEIDDSHDCFVCCLMSHGNDGFVSGVDEKLVSIKTIAEYFTSAKCPALAYKPKVFIVESCRGTTYEKKYSPEGFEYFNSSSEENKNSMANSGGNAGKDEGSITQEADFLFAYSTSPGKKSNLTPSGSTYIKHLFAVLNEHYKKLDVLRMLTIVNRKVCEEVFEDDKGTMFGQTPTSEFTLRKYLYFN